MTPAEAETLKRKPYRRHYAAARAAGGPIPPHLSSRFRECGGCGGRGQVGWSYLHDGDPVEVDDRCDQCGGAGFVEVPPTA